LGANSRTRLVINAGNQPTAAAWNPSGTRIVAVNRSGAGAVFNASSGKRLFRLTVPRRAKPRVGEGLRSTEIPPADQPPAVVPAPVESGRAVPRPVELAPAAVPPRVPDAAAAIAVSAALPTAEFSPDGAVIVTGNVGNDGKGDGFAQTWNAHD